MEKYFYIKQKIEMLFLFNFTCIISTKKMNSQAICAINLLQRGEHHDVMNYIKNFNGSGGFMYNYEEQYADVIKKADQLLDPDGMHSGGSWGCMLRTIQAVLNGETTVEELKEQDRQSDERYRLYLIEQERKKKEAAEAAQTQAEAQAQAIKYTWTSKLLYNSSYTFGE